MGHRPTCPAALIWSKQRVIGPATSPDRGSPPHRLFDPCPTPSARGPGPVRFRAPTNSLEAPGITNITDNSPLPRTRGLIAVISVISGAPERSVVPPGQTGEGPPLRARPI